MDKKLSFFLVLSLLGILFLFFLVQFYKSPVIKINNLTEKDINNNITLEAEVINVIDYPKSSFQILTLKDNTGTLKATSNSDKQLSLEKNQTYVITGKLEKNSYQNKTELQLAIDLIMKKS